MRPNIAEGRRQRDSQLAMFEASQTDFLSRCRAIAVDIANKRGMVSINDIRAKVDVPPGVHPSVLGSVFRDKRFYVAGYTQATHPAAHARIIRLYGLKGGAKW